MELTQIDGTTLELFRNAELAAEFGTSAPGGKPLLRLVGLLHSASRRWKAAAVGRYPGGENALADGLEEHYGPGQLNLADRGFFSVDRWIRFSASASAPAAALETAAAAIPPGRDGRQRSRPAAQPRNDEHGSANQLITPSR